MRESFTVGNNVNSYPTGTVYDTFNLSGVETGSDGMIIILQNGNTYNDDLNDTGYGLLDPRATILDNGATLGAGAGFGNNAAVQGSSAVGHSSIFRNNGDTNIIKGSVTYMLVNASNSTYDPNPGDELDEPTGITPTGTLHGTEYSNWNVYDSIGITQPSLGNGPGDVSYGYVNFVDDSTPGSTNYATPQSAATIPVPFTADFVARVNSDFGEIASDWVATSGVKGTQPFWGLGSATNTEPSYYAGEPINNMGGPNFDSTGNSNSNLNIPANVVTDGRSTVPSELQYPVGAGAEIIDGDVAVTNPEANQNAGNFNDNNPESYFLGTATVAITGNYNPATDTLGFTNTQYISGNFSTSTGVLTLTGYDSIEDWNAALEAVTFSYSGSTTGTRTVTYTVDNDAVQTVSGVTSFTTSSPASPDLIQINGAVANPPVVTGTSSTPVTWTEAVPQTSPPPSVVVAPGLSITDGSATQLTGATAEITGGLVAGQDSLTYNTMLATTDGITVTGNHNLTFSSTSPLPIATWQALLQTVAYTNSSENPTPLQRTVIFTVVDTLSNTSSITANSTQAINVVAVNDPPATTTTASSDSYTAGSPSILVDNGVTVVDPDSATLVRATVSITGGFHVGDLLSFTNQAGVTGAYNSASGVLTLSGAVSPLDYQIAMQAVTFSTTSAHPTGAVTISFQADDGATDPIVDGNIATKTINVTGVSASPPVVTTSNPSTTYTAGAASALPRRRGGRCGRDRYGQQQHDAGRRHDQRFRQLPEWRHVELHGPKRHQHSVQ